MLECNGVGQPVAMSTTEEMANNLRQDTIRWEAYIYDYITVIESLRTSIRDQESVLQNQESVAQTVSHEQRENILRMRKNLDEQHKALQGQLAELRSRTRESRNRVIATAAKLAQQLAVTHHDHLPAVVALTETVVRPPALQSQDTVVPAISLPEASLSQFDQLPDDSSQNGQPDWCRISAVVTSINCSVKPSRYLTGFLRSTEHTMVHILQNHLAVAKFKA